MPTIEAELYKPFQWQTKPNENRAARQHKPNNLKPFKQTNEIIDTHSTARVAGDSASAVGDGKKLVVGARGFGRPQPGCGIQESGASRGVFHITVNSSKANDALGIYVGVIDSSVGFRHESWGRAIAMGVHGGNLFQWDDPKSSGSLVRNALPGFEESPTSGSVISVKVDLEKNELAFAINGGPFTVARGIELPANVRPFVSLSGHDGDSISLSYSEKAPVAMPTPQVSQMKISSFAPVRESGDSVMAIAVE